MGQACAKQLLLQPGHGQAGQAPHYYRPQSMSSLQHVDLAKLKKLIKSRRLSPCYPPTQDSGDEECPICNWEYPTLNTASCCGQRICTECFVQTQTCFRPPGKSPCPFCKAATFSVRFLGVKPREQVAAEQRDSQLFEQAKARQLQEQLVREQERALAAFEQQRRQQPDAAANNSAGDNMPAAAAAAVDLDAAAAATAAARYGSSSSSTGSTSSSRAPEQQQQDQDQGWLEGVVGAAAGSSQELAAAAPGGGRQLINIYAEAGGSSGGAASSPEPAAAAAAAAADADGAARRLSCDLCASGLLPGYAVAELAGLHADELNEIMLEQALIASMRHAAAAAGPAGASLNNAAAAASPPAARAAAN